MIELAKKQLAAAQARYTLGVAPRAELRDAERQALEAQITFAELNDDQEGLGDGLRRLVELSEESLTAVQEMSRDGTATQSDVEAAQKELMEARLRVRMLPISDGQ